MDSIITLSSTIDRSVLNAAKRSSKRMTATQLADLARRLVKMRYEEKGVRDQLNKLVVRKKALAQQLLEQMITLNSQGVLAGGIMICLLKRRMTNVDKGEAVSRLTRAGFSDEQIEVINGVFKASDRYMYDVEVTLSGEPDDVVALHSHQLDG